MTQEEKRIAIAEACGWRIYKSNGIIYYERPGGNVRDYGVSIDNLPDYLNDLDAIHDAEKILTKEQHWKYISQLQLVCGIEDGDLEEYQVTFILVCATAKQRAEAFLQAIQKK